tara:strand:+ start:624 stop:1046 length:423 start_codon:yes stop_codon:yes gene_type:complete
MTPQGMRTRGNNPAIQSPEFTSLAAPMSAWSRGSDMSPLRMIYLALAVWGAVHPMYYFVSWFNENGYDIMAMVDAWHANAAASGLVWDLTIAAVTLSLWIIAEVAVRRNWVALIAIPATFFIGVSSGLPLYLFLRSAPVR